MTQTIQLNTPLGKAIANLFHRALPVLSGKPAGFVRVYIFGGCAVHLLTHARGSADIDAEIVASERLLHDEVIRVLDQPEYYEEGTEDLTLEFDANYNTTLGPLHEDYQERAICLDGFEGDQPLHVYVAAGVDLAISKLGRYTDQDKADIEALIEHSRFDVSEFERLGRQAIDYAVGNRSGMLSHLEQVIEPYLGDEHHASTRS